MKKVSVIIPVYNGEKYIKQTISNILKSTYDNLELVIINDGSIDNSLSICTELQKSDPRIYVYTKKNGGVAAARNYGIEKATGDYICFCDQDDIVAVETYEKQVASIEKYQSEICMCSTGRSIEGRTSDFECSEDACYEGIQVLEEILYPLLFSGYKVPINMGDTNRYPHIWNCMFRKDFIELNKIRFRTYVNYEDDLLVKIETLSKAERVSTLNYMGYYWRVNLRSETYTHKYVDDIGQKQQKSYEDMLGCLLGRIQDEKVLDLFTQVTFCKQYLDAVHNLIGLSSKKKYPIIKEYYVHEIYARDFEHCIEARKYLRKGRIKPGILLPIMAKKMTLLCYFMEILLDKILLITLHSQMLTKIERRMKQKVRKDEAI